MPCTRNPRNASRHPRPVLSTALLLMSTGDGSPSNSFSTPTDHYEPIMNPYSRCFLPVATSCPTLPPPLPPTPSMLLKFCFHFSPTSAISPPPPTRPPVAPTLVSSVQASALLTTQNPKEKESKGTEDVVEGSLWSCI